MVGRHSVPTRSREPLACWRPAACQSQMDGSVGSRARSPAPTRSDAIRTISPTRTVGCRTIGRTCSGSRARLMCPRTRVALGANFQYFSGKPWAATTQVSLPQGDHAHSARTSWHEDDVVAVAARFPCFETLRSWTRGTRRRDLRRAEPAQRHRRRSHGDGQPVQPDDFGKPIVFIDPRRAMISVRLNLGIESMI